MNDDMLQRLAEAGMESLGLDPQDPMPETKEQFLRALAFATRLGFLQCVSWAAAELTAIDEKEMATHLLNRFTESMKDEIFGSGPTTKQ